MKRRMMTITALGLLLGLAPWGAGRSAEAKTAAAQTPVPVLSWQPCAAPYQSGFDCATARVPLDYADPLGAPPTPCWSSGIRSTRRPPTTARSR